MRELRCVGTFTFSNCSFFSINQFSYESKLHSVARLFMSRCNFYACERKQRIGQLAGRLLFSERHLLTIRPTFTLDSSDFYESIFRSQ